MSNLSEALEFLSKGFSIIPVGKDKKPLIKWIEFQSRYATEEEVKQWFKQWPEANIGVVTGKLSGMDAVDCDSQEGIAIFEQYLPDNFETPIVSTPNNGRHYWFKHEEGIRNNARILKDIDTRGEGGYVIAPPSMNGNGRAYAWVLNYKEIALGSLPDAYKKILLSFSSFTPPIDTLNQSKVVNIGQNKSMFFYKGRRDEDMYHLALSLIKGKAEYEFINEVMNIVGENCDPPFPKNEIEIKIKSAIERAKRRDKTVKEQIIEWLESKSGQWQVKDYYSESNVVKKEEKHAVIVALKQLCDAGIIERIGVRAGNYRKVDKDFHIQSWWEGEQKHLPIQYPLGIEKFAKVYPGNIILLEGQKSQGKSQWALEFCRLNRKLFKNHKIRYQNVEMADSELKARFDKYPPEIMSKLDWQSSVDFVRRTSEWWDLILPDGLNVVDYLIEYAEPWLLPQYVLNIHEKLKEGIALVIVQRDPYKPYPVGGRGVRDIPRLIISLINHKIRLEDVKSFADGCEHNPTNMVRSYKQIDWWKFYPTSEWEKEEELKYKGFVKEK